MTRRYDILRGDTTSSNGTVLGGDATSTVNGREQAHEGDAVWCPACKTTGRIVCQGRRHSMRDAQGREAALSDDLCVCACSPSPVLVASSRDSYTDV